MATALSKDRTTSFKKMAIQAQQLKDNTGAAVDMTTLTALAPGSNAAVSQIGSSSAPYDFSTTANNAFAVYSKGEQTTGDIRSIYAKTLFGAAGGGETLRAYSIVNNATVAVGDTVNGAHVTLEVTGASGAVSGAGNAIRASLALDANTNAGGTLAGIQIDSQFDTAATVPAGTAAIRINDTGVKTWSYALRVPAVASGGLLAAHTTDAMTDSIRCTTEAGVTFYIMCTTTATNRTGGA